MFILMVFALIRFGGSSQAYPDIQIFYDRPAFATLLIYTAIGGAMLGAIFTTLRIYLLAGPFYWKQLVFYWSF